MPVTEWINNRFGVALNDATLAEIKDFSLIWNVFESSVCNNNFTIADVQKRIVERNYDVNLFTPHLQYFQNRYVVNGEMNNRFASLHFRPNDRQEFVRQVLMGELTETVDILLAIIIIIYRFRNNLFHGLKDIQIIDQQHTNFETANSFLMTFLDNY